MDTNHGRQRGKEFFQFTGPGVEYHKTELDYIYANYGSTTFKLVKTLSFKYNNAIFNSKCLHVVQCYCSFMHMRSFPYPTKLNHSGNRFTHQQSPLTNRVFGHPNPFVSDTLDKRAMINDTIRSGSPLSSMIINFWLYLHSSTQHLYYSADRQEPSSSSCCA